MLKKFRRIIKEGYYNYSQCIWNIKQRIFFIVSTETRKNQKKKFPIKEYILLIKKYYHSLRLLKAKHLPKENF